MENVCFVLRHPQNTPSFGIISKVRFKICRIFATRDLRPATETVDRRLSPGLRRNTLRGLNVTSTYLPFRPRMTLKFQNHYVSHSIDPMTLGINIFYRAKLSFRRQSLDDVPRNALYVKT